MVIGREKSVVRFQAGPSPANKNKAPLLPHRQKSDLRNIHRYIPRLHRQQTEQPPESLIGAALKTLAEFRCRDEELFSSARSTARDELKDIIDRSFVSLSRNSFGVQFLEPVHLLGFAHWQSYPEKKVICFLPLHIPKLKVQPGDPGAVIINLPRFFNSNTSLSPSDLQNLQFSGRYLSSNKFFSLVIKLLKRILAFKSVPQERIRSSETHGVLEIDLMDNAGWTGEIVICLATDRSDSVYYCRKPFYYPSRYVSGSANVEANTEYPGGSSEKTPRPVVSVQSNSKISLRTCTRDSGGRNLRTDLGDDDALSISGRTTKGTSMESFSVTSGDPIQDGDEDDITWYACQPRSENNLVRSISVTDAGVRLTALLVVFRLLQHDWRLLPFTCYHVQAAMLHETEQALDTSPRWQRNNLESCVRLLLCKLCHFVGLECLPHFSDCHLDLWFYLSRKKLALAKSALDRLVHSDTALLSLARRTGRFDADSIEATIF